ncbi:MAG: DUF167 domain-containing protein [Deltaproteobacteria bacterium]|nr:DUF167 domain-containing protein [Deltaproteobacteria bacterium]
MDLLELQQKGDSVTFSVKVIPRSSRSAVVGVVDGMLKVTLTAAPVDDAANIALVRLLARILDLPRSAINIVRGKRSRIKTVSVQGIDRTGIISALDQARSA